MFLLRFRPRYQLAETAAELGAAGSHANPPLRSVRGRSAYYTRSSIQYLIKPRKCSGPKPSFVWRGRAHNKAIIQGMTSALGQSRRFDRAAIISGLPPGADIDGGGRHVSNVLGRDISPSMMLAHRDDNSCRSSLSPIRNIFVN